MIKFCDICDNLLSANFANEILTFKCETCLLSYPSDVTDTLRRERIKEPDVMIFSKILNKAADDPATIKAHLKCRNDKCKGEICKQVRVGQDMRLYNICLTCHFQWLN